MSEYIKREELVEEISKAPAYFESGDIKYGIEIAESIVEQQPTADVAEVVRCKDCKEYELMTCNNQRFCSRFGGYVTEEDFCSRGERKDGASNA